MASMSGWDVEEVCTRLREEGLREKLVDAFRANEVDGRTLLQVTKTDLKQELEITALADRKAAWAAVAKLQASCTRDALHPAVGSPPAPVTSTPPGVAQTPQYTTPSKPKRAKSRTQSPSRVRHSREASISSTGSAASAGTPPVGRRGRAASDDAGHGTACPTVRKGSVGSTHSGPIPEPIDGIHGVRAGAPSVTSPYVGGAARRATPPGRSGTPKQQQDVTPKRKYRIPSNVTRQYGDPPAPPVASDGVDPDGPVAVREVPRREWGDPLVLGMRDVDAPGPVIIEVDEGYGPVQPAPPAPPPRRDTPVTPVAAFSTRRSTMQSPGARQVSGGRVSSVARPGERAGSPRVNQRFRELKSQADVDPIYALDDEVTAAAPAASAPRRKSIPQMCREPQSNPRVKPLTVIEEELAAERVPVQRAPPPEPVTGKPAGYRSPPGGLPPPALPSPVKLGATEWLDEEARRGAQGAGTTDYTAMLAKQTELRTRTDQNYERHQELMKSLEEAGLLASGLEPGAPKGAGVPGPAAQGPEPGGAPAPSGGVAALLSQQAELDARNRANFVRHQEMMKTLDEAGVLGPRLTDVTRDPASLVGDARPSGPAPAPRSKSVDYAAALAQQEALNAQVHQNYERQQQLMQALDEAGVLGPGLQPR
eukprot:TRINITY_DN32136_c0_g1_i1.p1 TRINITY_DN32136_c0_g1~~TRINITY_DN32136_c0_g1_i1.p1  ORF type:complete len:651 (+),score=180.93 TRINITY_DN32136_c0_g1_i1:96-2048(+)